MFWDGSRWVDETTKPTASLAPKKRRVRDWAATVAHRLRSRRADHPERGHVRLDVDRVGRRLVDELSRDDRTRRTTSPGSTTTATGSVTATPATATAYVRSTDQRRAGLTMRFSGTAIAWIGPVGPTRGSARVYLDGKYVKTVSTHAGTYRPQAVIYKAEFESYGRHTLRIVNLASAGHPTVAIDKIVVRGKAKSNRQELPAAPPPPKPRPPKHRPPKLPLRRPRPRRRQRPARPIRLRPRHRHPFRPLRHRHADCDPTTHSDAGAHAGPDAGADAGAHPDARPAEQRRERALVDRCDRGDRCLRGTGLVRGQRARRQDDLVQGRWHVQAVLGHPPDRSP